MKKTVTSKLAFGATAVGVSIAAVVGATPAGATSTSTIANVGLPSGGGLSTTAVGTGVRINRVDYTRVAGQICNFAGGWEGTAPGGGFVDGFGDVHSGCKIGMAGDSVVVHRDFKNKTWFKGKWKEGGQVGPGRTHHCIELNVWDFC
jgi:hypothetical protein